MTTLLEDGVIILFDALDMRRACLASALEPWARNLSLRLATFSPNQMEEAKEAVDGDVRLIILNLGGASLADEEQHRMLAAAKAMFKGPHAVICERPHADDAVAVATLGFQGFLPAVLPLDLVKQALDFIINGGSYYPREVLLAPMSHSDRYDARHRGTESSASLTQRQYEVLDKLRLGKSNKLIARDLHMQEATVKVHVRQIMRKLGAANRTQAALLAQSSTLPTDAPHSPEHRAGMGSEGIPAPMIPPFGDATVLGLSSPS